MKDVSYLRIEVYSDHPEVKQMADQVIDSYLADKTRKKREGEKCFLGNTAEAKRYIEAFKFRHPQLADYVCTGIGLLLQKFDSDFILNVIKIATSAGMPALPVHDEVVFPLSKQQQMQEIIAEAFKWTFAAAGNFGSIKVKLSTLDAEPTTIQLNL